MIRSLTQGTPYHVRIYAHNVFGYSIRGASDSRGEVKPVTLPSTPLDVKTEAKSKTSLLVKWKHPNNNGGSEVTKYRIRYDVSGSLNRDMGGTISLYENREIQQIEMSADSNNIGGTFRVMFEGESTDFLSHDISAENMKYELETLPTVGSVMVSRIENDSNGHVWKITFLTNRGNLTPLKVSTDSNSLYDISTTRLSSSNFDFEATSGTLHGTNVKVQVTTLSHGDDGFERQNVTLGATSNDISGAFSLTFDGMTTQDLTWDASAQDVKIAFEALESVGRVRVLRRIQDFGFTWSIMFLDRLGNQPLITATNISALSGTDVFVDVAPVDHGDLPPLDSALMGSVVVEASSWNDDVDVMQYEIQDLVQGEPYYVDVSAWNGVSDRFGPAQYATPALQRPCSSPERPRLVETSSTSESSFEISWSSPLSDNGCEVVDYVVEWDTHAGYSEVQRIRLNGVSGKFALSYKGHRTKYFNMFASLSEIELGVENLDGIGDVKLQMLSQTSSSVTYTVTFLSNVGDMDELIVHAMLKTSESSNTESSEFTAEEYLKGTLPWFDAGSVGIHEQPLGVAVVSSKNEIQQIELSGRNPDMGGSFVLYFANTPTRSISWNASALEVELELEGLETIHDVQVTRQDVVQTQVQAPSQDVATYIEEYHPQAFEQIRWTVTFVSVEENQGDLPSLLVSTVDDSRGIIASGGSLTGTKTMITVKELEKGGLPTRFEVTGLDSSKTHFARVSSRNAFGQSAETYAMNSISLTNTKPETPRESHVRVLSDSELYVSWKPPLRTGGSSLLRYTVQWSTDSSFSNPSYAHVNHVEDEEEHSYRISSLSSASSYHVRVLSYSSEGYSDPSDASEVEGGEVQVVTMASSSVNTFNLEFMGEATSSPLSTSSSASDLQSALQDLSTIGHVTVTKEEIGSSMIWRISFPVSMEDVPLIVSDHSDAVVSAQHAYSTQPTNPALRAPSQPVNVQLTIISNEKLGVRWDAPIYDGGSAVLGYRVEWDTEYNFRPSHVNVDVLDSVSLQSSYNNVTENTPTWTYQYAIDGLGGLGDMPYYVRVSAYNDQGFGASMATSPANAVPSPQVAYKPDSVVFQWSQNLIPDQLDVTWQAPTYDEFSFEASDGGTEITHYRIEWDTDMSFANREAASSEDEEVEYVHGKYDWPALNSDGSRLACVSGCTWAVGSEVWTVRLSTNGNSITQGGFKIVYNGVTGSTCFDSNSAASAIASEISALHGGIDAVIDGTRLDIDNGVTYTSEWRMNFVGFDVAGKAHVVDVIQGTDAGCDVFQTNPSDAQVSMETTKVQSGGVLRSGTPYSVRVTPINAAGLGDGFTVAKRTYDDEIFERPRSPPSGSKNVHVTSDPSVSTSLFVHWDAPLTDSNDLVNGADVTQYRIRAVNQGTGVETLNIVVSEDDASNDAQSVKVVRLVEARNTIQSVVLSFQEQSRFGFYTLSYDDNETQPISFDAEASVLETELETLSKIDDVVVTRVDTLTGFAYEIEFLDVVTLSVLDLVVSSSNLSPGTSLTTSIVQIEAPKHVISWSQASYIEDGESNFMFLTSLEGLDAATTYDVMVTAYNDRGWGDEVLALPLCDVSTNPLKDCDPRSMTRSLPSTPLNVVVSSPGNENEFGSTKLTVTWSTPSDEGGLLGLVDKFKIEWDTSASMNSNGDKPLSYGYESFVNTSPEVSVSAGVPLQFVIENLVMGENYHVRVTAHNSLGYGESSAKYPGRPRKMPTSPASVTLTNMDADLVSEYEMGTSLKVTISPPLGGYDEGQGGDPVDKYRIEWSRLPWTDRVKEVQTLTSTENVNPDDFAKFRLEMDTTSRNESNIRDSHVTGWLPYNIEAADLEVAIENLANIGNVDVSRSDLGNNRFMWTITFSEDYGDMPTLNVFEETDMTVSVSETTPGEPVTNGHYCESSVNVPSGDEPKCPELTDLSSGAPYEYVIRGLIPDQEYYVRVSAHNVLGYGEIRPSTPSKLFAPTQRPGKPTSRYYEGGSPTLHVSGPDSLTVRFGPPSFDGGANLVHYKIQWDTSPLDDVLSNPLGSHVYTGSEASEYMITGLNAGTRYYVRVMVLNDAAGLGYGEPALTIPNSEVPRNAPSAPSTATLSNVDEQSLLVSWSGSEENGNSVDRYRVELFTKAPKTPYFGVTEVQDVTVVCDDGTFTLAWGDFIVPIGVASVTRGSFRIEPSSDVTPHVQRGDWIRIDNEEYQINTDMSEVFDDTYLPLKTAYLGLHDPSVTMYARRRSDNIPCNASAYEVQNALQNVESLGVVTVTETVLSATSKQYSVSLISAEGSEKSNPVGPLAPYSLIPNPDLLSGTGHSVNVAVSTPGVTPETYMYFETTENSIVVPSLTTGVQYYARVSAHNDRGFGATASTTPEHLSPLGVPGSSFPVSLSEIESGKLEVRYEQTAADNGANVQYYKVEWRHGQDQTILGQSTELSILHNVQRVRTSATTAPITGTFTLSFGDFYGSFTSLACSSCASISHGDSTITTSSDLRSVVPRGDFVEIDNTVFRVCVTGLFDETTVPICDADDASVSATYSGSGRSEAPVYMLDTSLGSIRVDQYDHVVTGAFDVDGGRAK